MVHGRWHDIVACDNERTLALWTNGSPELRGEVLAVDTTGPAAVSRSNSIELVDLQPKRDLFALRRPVNTVFRVSVGLYTATTGGPTAASGTRPPCTGGVHAACRDRHRGGVSDGGRLKPDVELMMRADRPLRLGGDIATFEGMRHIVVAYSKYDQAYTCHKTKTQ